MARRSRRRSWLAVLTFSALALALGVCVSWLVTAPAAARWEPVIQTLALCAAISGVFAERRAAAQERLQQTLQALAGELVKNAGVLADPRFAPLDPAHPVHRVFPRPVLSASDAALVSGVLAERRHSALTALLHEWRDTVHELNRRLDLAEVRSFVVEPGSAELIRIDESLRRDGGHLQHARALHTRLETLLRAQYGGVVDVREPPPAVR
ncbi:hypothetical protein ACFQLX_01130 [Streptomyces polyrhachis]|uniref:Uncharacterized protein n=1 Tax=Streptomyces polyrhachis TaxID=1282885 RepID=A0ABW2GAM0_9ACTN